MRLFIVSIEHPSVGTFEIVSFDKDTQRAVLRGQYDDYELYFPMHGPIAEKRKQLYRLERRE